MMQNAAILWHISLLAPADQKGLALGLVGLVRVIPIMVFSLISGVVADALDRRKLMTVTQIGAGDSGRLARLSDVSRPVSGLAGLPVDSAQLGRGFI